MASENKTLDIADSMLTQVQIDNLFTGDGDDDAGGDAGGKKGPGPEGGEGENKSGAEGSPIDVDRLFDDPESVGDGEGKKGNEDDAAPKGGGSSPTNGFYSSIAKAFKEDGIFLTLDDEDVKGVKNQDDFVALVQNEINDRVDQRVRRVDEALGVGVEPTEIRNYEQTLNFLSNITEDQLSDEGDDGVELRQQIIFNDLLKRGFSEQRAKRDTERAFKDGTDVQDAKDALVSLRKAYSDEYDGLVGKARKEQETRRAEARKADEALRKSIMEDEKLFGNVELDKATRRRIYENLSKPIYEDRKTGRRYTALQLYERDNRSEFLKNVSVCYTLTDGFRDIGKLFGRQVSKELKRGLTELEGRLRTTGRTSDGDLTYMSGDAGRGGGTRTLLDDPGWDLNI